MNGGDVTIKDIFDNEITLLYQSAEENQLPVSFLTSREDEQGVQIYSLLDAILEEYEKPGGFDVAALFDSIRTYFDVLQEHDGLQVFLMAVYMVLEQDQSLTDAQRVQKLNMYGQVLNPDNFIPFSQESLEGDYDIFTSQLQDQLAKDLSVNKRITYVRDILRRYLPDLGRVAMSKPNITGTLYSYSPFFKNVPVKAEDGLDIFNEVLTSQTVPYAKYIDENGRVYHKVYQGLRREEQPNYKNTVLSEGKKDINTLYLTVWMGDEDEDFSTSAAKNFYTAIYNLENNYLSIESSTEKGTDDKKYHYSDIARSHVAKALPNLDLGVGNEHKVAGDFEIYGQTINEISFIDMLINDPVFNSTLYNDDVVTPYPKKTRFIFHSRPSFMELKYNLADIMNPNYLSNYASISLILKEVKPLEDKKIVVDEKEWLLPKGTPFYTVNISQAASRKVIDQFIPMFKLLLLYYQDVRQAVEGEYFTRMPISALLPAMLNNIGDELPVVIENPKNKRIGRSGGNVLRELKRREPEMFGVKDYSRFCQSGYQPSLVDDEVARLSLDDRQRLLEAKKIIAFPRENPHFFQCPEGMIPGLKASCRLRNVPRQFLEKYPYLPCCYKATSQGSKKNYENYIHYWRGGVPTKKDCTAKATNIISTNKVLASDGLAMLPTAVDKILKGYVYEDDDEDEEDISKRKMVRMGVPLGNNSLIHCALFAVSDPGYFQTVDEDAREDYAGEIRKMIADRIHPELLKQEMFDYQLSEISAMLRDEETLFEADKFYRAIEEAFNVNLFVFLSKGEGKSETGEIEVPRFKLFHARPLRSDRNTIIVMKTQPSEAIPPQYELIIDVDSTKKIVRKIFEPETEMYSICYENLQRTLRTITWITEKNEFVINANLYSFVNYPVLFSKYAVGQSIDANGKLRFLTLNLGGTLITISTIPGQPGNLPTDKTVYHPSHTAIIPLLGAPEKLSYNPQEMVDGFWYKIVNLEEGLFVPIAPIRREELTIAPKDQTPGAKNPIETYTEEITPRISKLKFTLNIIVELIRWVFSVELKNFSRTTAQKFFDQYVTISDPEIGNDVDSSLIYNFKHVLRSLPKVTTAQEAVSYIQQIPEQNLVSRGKFVMYNRIFAQKIYEMLDHYYQLISDTEIRPVTFIRNFYQSEADFKPVEASKIFVDDSDFQSWLRTVNTSANFVNYFTIHDSIKGKITKDPYIYRDYSTGKIYLLQTVSTLEEALYLDAEWHNNQINLVETDHRLSVDVAYVLYGVNTAGNAVPIKEENRQPGQFYYSVLRHGNSYSHDGEYAAMLEIL